MTKELQSKLEGMCQNKFYQDDVVPALLEMKQNSLEALASDHDEKVSAFLRGRIAVLSELINLESNLKKRQTEEALKTRKGITENARRRNPGLTYIERES